jgi:hypothetical protein
MTAMSTPEERKAARANWPVRVTTLQDESSEGVYREAAWIRDKKS